jgi:hypothetical protein
MSSFQTCFRFMTRSFIGWPRVVEQEPATANANLKDLNRNLNHGVCNSELRIDTLYRLRIMAQNNEIKLKSRRPLDHCLESDGGRNGTLRLRLDRRPSFSKKVV